VQAKNTTGIMIAMKKQVNTVTLETGVCSFGHMTTTMHAIVLIVNKHIKMYRHLIKKLPHANLNEMKGYALPINRTAMPM
jgi:hypothetical protein